MQMVSVKSSNLAAIGYSEESKTLRVLFQEGRCYDYLGVSQKVYEQLMAAESKGHFFQDVIRERYSYEKVNLEKESNMPKATAKTKPVTQAAVPTTTAEQPKATPAPAAPAAATPTAQPTKQDQTIARLLEGWKAKGIDLSKLTCRDDGKYKLLVVGEGWPTVQVGSSGGVTVVELRSYPDGFTAAMEGLERYQKQQRADAKRAAAAQPAQAPAPAPAQPAPQPTPTARKKAAHEQVEQQLQAQA